MRFFRSCQQLRAADGRSVPITKQVKGVTPSLKKLLHIEGGTSPSFYGLRSEATDHFLLQKISS
jgi:hypothetical protein